MTKLTVVAFSFLMASVAVAGDASWQPCWYGQTIQDQACKGEAVLLSAFDVKQTLSGEPSLRLPTRAELERLFTGSHVTQLREHAHQLQQFRVLTSEFMQHGNEFLATTVDIRTGRVELLPWREPALVILLETTNR